MATNKTIVSFNIALMLSRHAIIAQIEESLSSENETWVRPRSSLAYSPAWPHSPD